MTISVPTVIGPTLHSAMSALMVPSLTMVLVELAHRIAILVVMFASFVGRVMPWLLINVLGVQKVAV